MTGGAINPLFSIYRALPAPARNFSKHVAALVPIEWRMGRRFHRELEILEQRQWWSRSELEQYQNERLRWMVRHAYENVPYYERLFKDHRLHPTDIQTQDDLKKIPILAKDTVRESPRLFMARNLRPRQCVFVTTSGTTGRMVRLASPRQNEYLYGGPFEWRFYRWGGYQPRDRCAVFRAHYVSSRSDPIYSFNPVQNNVYFSIFHLNADALGRYLEGLSRYRPAFINAYISILHEMVKLLREGGSVCPIPIRAIFTIGEYVTADQRQTVESFFGCRIFDWYGMEERAVIAAECERHTRHHVISDYGIMELVDDDPPNPLGAKRIIATSLTNFASPLIRYDTEDTAVPVEEACPCGRGFPLIQIVGDKSRFFILDKQSRPMSLMGAIEHTLDNARQYQFAQDRAGCVTLRVVKGRHFTKADDAKLRKNCEVVLDGRVEFDIEYVDHIARTAGGKIPPVLSKA